MMSKKLRVFLVIFGCVILFNGLYFFENYFALIGILPLLVGATGFCPLCYFLGRCRIKR